MVLSAATGSVDLKTATLSPVRLPSSQPKVVVLRATSLASAATCFELSKTPRASTRGDVHVLAQAILDIGQAPV